MFWGKREKSGLLRKDGINYLKDKLTNILIRKYPLCGYFLATQGRQMRITCLRKNTREGDRDARCQTDRWTTRTEGQTDFPWQI